MAILRSILTSLHGREIGLAKDRTLIVRAEPDQVTLAAAKGTANITLVTIQSVNAEGAAVAGVQQLTVWLSDASTGIGLTATTASGAVGAGTSGTDFGDLTTKKAKVVITDATGKYILSITDTAKTLFVVCASLAKGRLLAPQTLTLVTASYG